MRSFLLAAAIVSGSLTMASSSGADPKKVGSAFEEAERLMARGMLKEAALVYGAFALNAPQDPRAPRAYVDAMKVHIGLGYLDFASAESALQDFENTFVPVNAELWSEMAFAMIDRFVDRQDRKSALVLLHRATTLVGEWTKAAQKKKGDLQLLREIEVRARGRLARMYTALGDHGGANAEWARIETIHRELFVWPGKKPARNAAKFQETMDFIAESFFHAAEAKRYEAERLPLPAYIGNGDRDSVLVFVNGPGTRWVENRRFLVEEAQRLYALVIGEELPKPVPPKPPPPPSSSGMIGLIGGDPEAPLVPFRDDSLGRDPLDPLPSPQWGIAAAERIGYVWSSFVREYLRMPVPRTWRTNGIVPGTDLTYEDLRGEWGYSFVDPPYVPFKEMAKSAYRECLNQSIRFRIANEHTRACIEWLSKNYGAEYHVIDEFGPRGDFFALGQYARPAALPSTGTLTQLVLAGEADVYEPPYPR